ncbi:hypothetical protein CB1_001536001 [Camelus ferus]|nr:hypothetical protein CB1_001536001 [Camelus ferus]
MSEEASSTASKRTKDGGLSPALFPPETLRAREVLFQEGRRELAAEKLSHSITRCCDPGGKIQDTLCDRCPLLSTQDQGASCNFMEGDLAKQPVLNEYLLLFPVSSRCLERFVGNRVKTEEVLCVPSGCGRWPLGDIVAYLEGTCQDVCLNPALFPGDSGQRVPVQTFQVRCFRDASALCPFPSS